MAKSLLHKELQMFPDIPVRKKTRIQNILKDIGINSLEELGYEEREKYLREIEKLKGNLLQKSYLEELDAMKLASIKWAAERRAASDWNVRYSEQKFFLPYFPVYKIAKSFDPEEDREMLQLFAFICSLSFDVYIKKQIIEKVIDSFPTSRH